MGKMTSIHIAALVCIAMVVFFSIKTHGTIVGFIPLLVAIGIFYLIHAYLLFKRYKKNKKQETELQ